MGLKSSKPKVNAVMMGLDAAGKTTMLYQLRYGEVVTTIPTIGFNVETSAGPDFAFTVWDVGGKDKIRPLWRHYYEGMNAIIFMVDSNDRDRVDQAREQLAPILSEDELRHKCLLMYFNKQDLPGAMRKAELVDKLRLNQIQTRHWHVQECCATLNDGLQQGLDWLLKAVHLPPPEENSPAPKPGHYITCESLEVIESAYLCSRTLGLLEEGADIEVLEVVDRRERLEAAFGRIESPYAGWVDLTPGKVRSPDYVVSLEVASVENGRIQLNCTNIAGCKLVSYELTKEETVSEFQSKLAELLQVQANTLKVVLPNLQVLSMLPGSSLLFTALDL